MAPRSRHAAIAAALAGFVALATQAGAGPAPAERVQAAPVAQSGGFLETFDGSPSTPQPWHPADWDVQVHSRNPDTWTNLEPMTGTDAAHHGTDCAAPPATHDEPGMAYADAVFQCHDHVMTAIKAGGYGVIYLTPPALLDFSSGEAVLSFDTSTLVTSARDWQDIWITPFDDNLTLPFNEGDVDLHGVPRRGVTVKLETTYFGQGPAWVPSVISNFVQTSLGANCCIPYKSFLVPDAARRDTLEVRLRADHIKVWMPAYNKVWADKPISPPLDWSQGVVQLGHHSYNPHKACTDNGKPADQCPADTWHWDNVSLSPAVPFTIIRSTPRMVTSSTQDVTFAAPAPANSHVRFSAVGSVETSLDGGTTWTAQAPQASSVTTHPEHADNYWISVPTGTQSVRVRLSTRSWYTGPFDARDFALWAPGTGQPTPTPTMTATQGAATSTPAPTATATPTPLATAIVDNLQATLVGTWTSSQFVSGYYATNYQHDGNTAKCQKSARFVPSLPAAGTYRVSVRSPAGSTDRDPAAPVAVVHAGQTYTTTVNQTINSNLWVTLGDFTHTAANDGSEYVEYTTCNTTHSVIIDAVRWEQLP